MEMSDTQFHNLAMTAKWSQLISRYCMTNNKNNDNNNKYNRNDCGRRSLDCVTKKSVQWVETNWEQASLVMLNCACLENKFSKNLFPRVASRGLYWGNVMYKLKRSILNGNDGVSVVSHLAPAHLILLICTCVYIA